MAAAIYDFSIEQGSDFEITFQYLDTNGIGIDLTDKCILLRAKRSDGNLIYRFNSICSPKYHNSNDTANNCAFPTLPASPWYANTSDTPSNYFLYSIGENRQNGNIVWKLSSTVTSLFTCDNLLYELDIIDSSIPTSPLNTRLASGIITIIKRNFPIVTDCANVQDYRETPSVTPPPAVTPTPLPVNLCLPEDCLTLDIYSKVYTGDSIVLYDKINNSGTINVSDTGTLSNIEVAFNGLHHSNPQDLTAILMPPSGDPILLFANSHIINYVDGFSFMISNKANTNTIVNNVTNGGLCNIVDKTAITKFNNTNLRASIDHLLNTVPSGNWTLYLNDNDWLDSITSGTSGLLDSWKLILTYNEI